MESFNYITKEGDRIDTLAVKFYGGLYGIAILSDANPSIPLDAVFPLGTVLIVPIIEVPENPSNNLPPWKK